MDGFPGAPAPTDRRAWWEQARRKNGLSTTEEAWLAYVAYYDDDKCSLCGHDRHELAHCTAQVHKGAGWTSRDGPMAYRPCGCQVAMVACETCGISFPRRYGAVRPETCPDCTEDAQ